MNKLVYAMIAFLALTIDSTYFLLKSLFALYCKEDVMKWILKSRNLPKLKM